jgi:L-lactate dehydrogenase complex protein LldG
VPGREEMLDRIRKALRRPPGAAGSGTATPSGSGDAAGPPGEIIRRLTPEEALTRFEAEWTRVGGLSHRAASLSELENVLRGVFEAAGAKEVVLSRNPLLEQLGLPERLRALGQSVACWRLPGPLPREAAGQDGAAAQRQLRSASFAAAVGITGVEFVLAETGSLVLTSRTEGSQLASLAPPVHVALYRRSQVVGSLDEVLAKLGEAAATGRSIVFITGPSRTADIEQILVRGVHGPGQVHAILVEESCFR